MHAGFNQQGGEQLTWKTNLACLQDMARRAEAAFQMEETNLESIKAGLQQALARSGV